MTPYGNPQVSKKPSLLDTLRESDKIALKRELEAERQLKRGKDKMPVSPRSAINLYVEERSLEPDILERKGKIKHGHISRGLTKEYSDLSNDHCMGNPEDEIREQAEKQRKKYIKLKYICGACVITNKRAGSPSSINSSSWMLQD